MRISDWSSDVCSSDLPQAWAKTAEVVRDRLAARDPEGAADYAAGAARLLEAFHRLDVYAERAVAGVPAGRRILVTAHDAFGYFGRRYGFEVLGIQGLSTERSEEHTSELESLMRISYDVFCLNKKKHE